MPYVDVTWGRFSSFSWWRPSARTSRARPAGERDGRNPECLDYLPRRSLVWPLWTKLSPPPYPGAAPDVAKNPQVRRPPPAFIFRFFTRFPFPHTSGRSPYASDALHVGSPHTSARLFPYAGAVPPHVSTAPTIPYACADPHRFSWLTIHFHDSSIQPPSSTNPDIGFSKTSVSGPANQAPAGLHKFPASTAGAVPHVQTGHQPAETSDRLIHIYASNRFSADSLHQRRVGGAPGHGVASRRGVDATVGACVQARLKAGSCGADPRGTETGWTRQKPADAEPDPQNG